MKITEPKTPFQYGDNAMDDEEEEEDVSIDPRFVNVDEVDMARNKPGSGSQVPKRSRESEIPGLELGEAEDTSAGAELDDDRVVRNNSLSRDSSKEKHVSVGGDSDSHIHEQVGMPTREEQEKHKKFEEQRKRHYEMRNVKDMLG